MPYGRKVLIFRDQFLRVMNLVVRKVCDEIDSRFLERFCTITAYCFMDFPSVAKPRTIQAIPTQRTPANRTNAE